jgi:hypothetical protein
LPLSQPIRARPIIVAAVLLATTPRASADTAACSEDAAECVYPLSTVPPKARLGLWTLTEVGVAGSFRNPSPSGAVGLSVSLPWGALRWHASAGFESLNGHNGARLDFLSFGVPVEISTLGGHGHLEIEPIVGVPLELITDGTELFVSVATVLAVHVVVGHFAAFVAPVGVDARWAALTPYSSFGIGWNWPFSAEVALQF